MRIRPYRDPDFHPLVALWRDCGLIRPWNDPAADIRLCRSTASSALFVGFQGDADRITASIMAGSDGHRGWLYYLAVDPERRHAGHGQAMVLHAEARRARLGIRKVELMIRDDNGAVRAFYEKLGYQMEPRIVMSRWLEGDA